MKNLKKEILEEKKEKKEEKQDEKKTEEKLFKGQFYYNIVMFINLKISFIL